MEQTAKCDLPSKRQEHISRAFSVFLALYPILCMYKAIYRFTIGDVLLILFLSFSLTNKIRISKPCIVVFSFVTVAGFELMLNLMFSSVTAEYEPLSLVFRLVKFIFYMCCVFLVGEKHFNAEVFYHAIIFVAVAATLFLVIQYVLFYRTGTIILGRIPGLPLYLEEYSDINYDLVYSNIFRPCSFFLEPASFCQYAVVALVMTLFRSLNKRGGLKNIIFLIIITVGIVMTTAAQGILYIFVIYAFFSFKNSKSRIKSISFLIAMLVLMLICYNHIDVVRFGVNRLLFDDAASNARLGSYHYITEMGNVPLFFGYGYGVTPNNEYLAGFAYIWYGCGLVGVMLSLGIFASFYLNSKTDSAKLICLLFLVMFVGTALFYNYMLFWYFTVIWGLSGSPRKEYI